MPTEPARLPVTVALHDGEALDGYLERVAAANGLDRPELVTALTPGSGERTYLTTKPAPRVVARVARIAGTSIAAIHEHTLDALVGLELSGLDHRDKTTWRRVAARGWPPERGTALCSACLEADGIWRITWRHPWVTTCPRHECWLIGRCPTCQRRFRSQRTPLRSVDALDGTCGNPAGARGHNCSQPLTDIPVQPAPSEVLACQARIHTATRGDPVHVVDALMSADGYLAEVRALAVLLLNLAVQPGAEYQAGWAELAREDHQRSTGSRGARWALAPPADLILRGCALAAADAVLRQPSLDAAADALHPWTALAPSTNDGQLGWLADHTTMTPLLSRLIMAATATRRRLSTLLDQPTITTLPSAAIPQVLPADLYAECFAGMLEVTDLTGRLFVSLCLARQHQGTTTWAEAAALLGLPPELGTKTARACTADLLASPSEFLTALARVANDLDPATNHRDREDAVRRLARSRGWYRSWARRHLSGSHATSQSYAITWLWTEYAHGHIDTSPGWQHPPDHHDRAHFRAYARRLGPAATEALTGLVATTTAA